MNKTRTLPRPSRTERIGLWRIEEYLELHEVWLTSPRGKVYIIRNSTYEFTRIPKYVLAKLEKLGFLDLWKVHQTKESVERLNQILANYRAFLDQTQIVQIEE